MQSIPDWVVRRLREVPGLDVQPGDENRVELRCRRWKATLRVRPHGRLSSAELQRVLRLPRSSNALIATHAVSGATREALAGSGISWIERDTGVVHLDTARFFVHLERSKASAEPHGGERLLSFGGTTGLIAEVLLEYHRGRPFTLREVADRVGATKGRVSQVFSRLLALGFLDAEGQTRTRVYHLRDPGRMLDEWGRSGPAAKESSNLYAWARTPTDLYRRLGRLDASGIVWALGGVAAANSYVPSLSVLPTPEVWVNASVPAEQIALELEAEVVGASEAPNLRIWQSGADPALKLRQQIRSAATDEPVWVTSRPRAYVEARSAGGRGIDAAEALRNEMGL